MHPDLSPPLHTKEHNILFNLLKEFHTKHSVLKFYGHWNDLDREMQKWLKRGNGERRAKNRAFGEAE
uniref:Uncharacterized protein n=1 Tax=Vombatus ursinus TaxID=29139 RepID=A0A4X2LW50_VOMUR